MRKGLLILLSVLGFSCLFSVEMIDSIYKIQLPENIRQSIGISAISSDKRIMEENALSQAAVIYSKLDSSYGIDKYISICYDDQSIEDFETVSVRYSVSSDIEQMKNNYKLLINNKSQELCGYNISFYSKKEIDAPVLFEKSEMIDSTFFCNIKLENDVLYCYGSGKTTQMDDALDEAFTNALLEYSKYQNMRFRSLHKNLNDKNSLVYNIESVNKVSNLGIKRAQLIITRDEIGLKRYQVCIELLKRMNDESDSRYTSEIQLHPFAR